MQNPEQLINYVFKNKKLLNQALTHSSSTTDIHKNYERLEFLGDRILGVGVAKMLYEKFPDEPEGSLSQRHTALVCKEAVSEVVKNLGLDNYIIIANEDAKDSINVLCDVGEAVIAAICVDSNINNAMEFINKNWEGLLEKYKTPPKDAKTMLQEVSWKMKLGNPSYEIVAKNGSEHLPVFTVEVSLAKDYKASGKGTNKKLAEQSAAREMLAKLGY